MTIITILGYNFIDRALLAGTFISIACAILGVFLVLKNLALIGDGLSHVSFGALALGLFLGISPYYIAIPGVIIGAIFIYLLSDKLKVLGDAAIGIISAAGVSLGIIFASVGQGFNTDLMGLLFGNILTISPEETILSSLLALTICLLVIFNYHSLVMTTFNEDLARTSGVKVKRINLLLYILTALTVILSVRITGIMLTSALLVIPATSALQIRKGFRTTLLYSVLFSTLSVVLGIIISFIINWPTGATIILTNISILLIIVIMKRLIK